MRGLTYPDLADRFEVEVCGGECGERNHRRGWVDKRGLIHWDRARAVTRAGLRHFLMLVNEAYRIGSERDSRSPVTSIYGPRVQAALRIYNASVFATKTAMYDLGVLLPSRLAETDKARVRSLLVGAPSGWRRDKMGRWAGLR